MDVLAFAFVPHGRESEPIRVGAARAHASTRDGIHKGSRGSVHDDDAGDLASIGRR